MSFLGGGYPESGARITGGIAARITGGIAGRIAGRIAARVTARVTATSEDPDRPPGTQAAGSRASRPPAG
ncbi:MAG: hypothetical protein ACLP5E_23755 [Streptosporangiaceae bacterium]